MIESGFLICREPITGSKMCTDISPIVPHPKSYHFLQLPG